MINSLFVCPRKDSNLHASCFPHVMIFEKSCLDNQQYSIKILQNGVSRAIFAHVFTQEKEQIRHYERPSG